MELVYETKLPGKRKSRFSIFYRKYMEQTSTKVNVPIVKAYNRLKFDADETELMKMAVRAGYHKITRRNR
jgi:hypothetical protein